MLGFGAPAVRRCLAFQRVDDVFRDISERQIGHRLETLCKHNSSYRRKPVSTADMGLGFRRDDTEGSRHSHVSNRQGSESRGGAAAAEGLDISDLENACQGSPGRCFSFPLSRRERDFVAIGI